MKRTSSLESSSSPKLVKTPLPLSFSQKPLRRRIGISEVVIHRIKWAVAAEADCSASITASYCEKPRKSTGAGDRFNAGFCLGILLGLDARARLTLGCASSGYFVRHAESATLEQLTDFIDHDYL